MRLVSQSAAASASRHRTAPEHSAELDVYLTDEVFLYRIVDVALTESGDMADVEDCLWLDVVRIPMRDLLARELRIVTPG